MTAATTQIATTQDAQTMTGAQVVIQALVEQGVEVIFGYPGGAVLPLYDALFQQNKLRHVLVRHEQAATHARAHAWLKAIGMREESRLPKYGKAGEEFIVFSVLKGD